MAGIKDVFTCEIVGYAMGSRMTKELVSASLKLALAQKRPKEGLILHSDRGSQASGIGGLAGVYVTQRELL
ncbi:hypothetical protein C1H71_12100 [Iodobacter fluviatilis]|uniref:Integrase catalytic domain-containing protein n=1 Tax=Iodobacter fluviatilis TaxID=537 RepID=A0A7G3G834_9NEIS|nr:hypothetical protein C1H71_06260 [Iodobacter fluviatilis]QBC44200.1 hypothetical protein C1H71_12100 [Iodobacter fluviatilis]